MSIDVGRLSVDNPVERRADDMSTLEAASVEQNIKPLSRFLSEVISKSDPG